MEENVIQLGSLNINFEALKLAVATQGVTASMVLDTAREYEKYIREGIKEKD